jgi:hypothetical protein
MQSNQIHRGIFFGFGIVALLFLALYTVLSLHNRPAADDFYFLDAVQTKGTWNAAWDAYNTWITRWSTLLFLGFSIKFFGAGTSLLWFHLFTLVALAVGIGLVMRKIFLLQTKSSPGLPLLLLYSILFLSSFFLLTFRTGETWFWFTSVCMYLWPVIVLLFGIYLTLNMESKSIAIVAIVLCFLFPGGGSEVVALEAWLLLALAFAFLAFGKPFPFSDAVNKRTVLFAIAALSVSLFIAWIGPGRAIRQEALADPTWDQQLLLPVKATGYFLLMQLPLKIHWILFFTIPWMILKNRFIPSEEKPVPVVFKSVFRDLLIFLVFAWIHFIIVATLLKSFPPFRTWITLSLALAIFCAVTGWRLGYLVTSARGLWSASIIFIVVSSLLLFQTLIVQRAECTAYSKAVDERMEYLTKMANEEKQVLEVKPLPTAGMLYSAEISSDSSYFTNKHLREYLDLKSPVKLKNNQ